MRKNYKISLIENVEAIEIKRGDCAKKHYPPFNWHPEKNAVRPLSFDILFF